MLDFRIFGEFFKGQGVKEALYSQKVAETFIPEYIDLYKTLNFSLKIGGNFSKAQILHNAESVNLKAYKISRKPIPNLSFMQKTWKNSFEGNHREYPREISPSTITAQINNRFAS